MKYNLRPRKAVSPSPPPLALQEDGRLDVSTSLEDPRYQALFDRNASSPFLSLPGEVRNMIWAYVFCDPICIIDDNSHTTRWDSSRVHYYIENPGHWHDVSSKTPSQYPHLRAQRRSFLLPHVCRQIYIEVSPLCYRTIKWGPDLELRLHIGAWTYGFLSSTWSILGNAKPYPLFGAAGLECPRTWYQ